MSTLTTDRIRYHATKLGLTHLTEKISQLGERTEATQMATWTSSTYGWKKNSACVRHAGSATG